MSSVEDLRLKWCGAAHYQILYKGTRIVIDPLYTRLAGDLPHLEEKKEDAQKMDLILLTHGHLDHSMDFPYLLNKHAPTAYAPQNYLRKLAKRLSKSGRHHNFPDCHPLEEAEGKTINIADMEITPYRIGTEDIDFWFIRAMCMRPLINFKPKSIPHGLRWLLYFTFGNCFAFHFQFLENSKTMLYFGNLTGDVKELHDVERVDVLAIPYCPANQKWQDQTQYLINRFSPGVTLVHHFDNFMNPFTFPKYLDLANYQKAIQNACPEAVLYFSKFDKEVTFQSIVGLAKDEATSIDYRSP